MLIIIDEKNIPKNPYPSFSQTGERTIWHVESRCYEEGQQSILSKAKKVDINQKYNLYGYSVTLRKCQDFIKKYPTFGDYLLSEE